MAITYLLRINQISLPQLQVSKTLALELIYTLDTIDEAVKKFWDSFKSCHVFAFNGEMGAGKTTFIHHLCDYLKVEDTVSSPTFALINEYHFASEEGKDNIIYHLDWYRLRDTTEAINAGMEDCIAQAGGGKAYCFIEWPEKAGELLIMPFVRINIESMSNTDRRMLATLVDGTI